MKNKTRDATAAAAVCCCLLLFAAVADDNRPKCADTNVPDLVSVQLEETNKNERRLTGATESINQAGGLGKETYSVEGSEDETRLRFWIVPGGKKVSCVIGGGFAVGDGDD